MGAANIFCNLLKNDQITSKKRPIGPTTSKKRPIGPYNIRKKNHQVLHQSIGDATYLIKPFSKLLGKKVENINNHIVLTAHRMHGEGLERLYVIFENKIMKEREREG